MKKIVQIVALVILLVSCENDIKTNLPAFLGEKDNISWRASDTKVTANPGGTITINAYKDNELVTLTVPNTVGTYLLAEHDYSSTGITLDYTPFADSTVQVYINGIALTEGYGTKTLEVYFSNDGGILL